MNKPAFTFDDVRVRPDRQIGLHSHAQWELSHVLVGRGMRTIGDHTEAMTAGEIILIPPNIPHVWEFDTDHTDADGNISNISVFFYTATLDALSAVLPESMQAVSRVKSITEAISLQGKEYKKIQRLLMAMREATDMRRLSLMIEMLGILAEADGRCCVGRNNTRSRAEQRLESIRVFCNCNYARDITLDEVASYAGMNKSALCTFMRRQTGKSLSEFVNEIRL